MWDEVEDSLSRRPAAAAPIGAGDGGLDAATLQLERLVEETHRALVRDGLVQPSESGGGGFSSSCSHAPAIPSLDAVDRALEELQRGLAEIDGALRPPSGGGGGGSTDGGGGGGGVGGGGGGGGWAAAGGLAEPVAVHREPVAAFGAGHWA